jgi:iron-sulfur cluster assembly accessory protein|tara:strand:+ start:1362 stop:1673 length:312 start_codon:yes stop_codon:yes gene_type:complete
MITLTDNAIQKLKEFLEPTEIVRLAVEGGGCHGFQYRFGVSPSTEIAEDDYIIEDKIRLAVDPVSYMYLENVEIDYEEKTFNSAFKINNPDTKATCSCGSSFS